MPPFAVIDMGSNSFRLCIFDDSKTGDERKTKYIETCRLGEGFHQHLEIQPEPFKRGVAACAKYLEICKTHAVEKVYCFATATVREAVNRELFLAAIAKLGLEIHILSGEQEALCGFLGTAAGVLEKGSEPDNEPDNEPNSKTTTENIAVLDIGGASTELAIGNIGGFKGLFACENKLPTLDEIKVKSEGTCMGLDFSPIAFSHSFKVGAVRLTDMFDENFTSEIQFLHDTFAKFSDEISLAGTRLFGIGGTVTSLCGLIAGCENYKPQLHGFKAAASELETLSTHICEMPKQARQNLPFLKPKRKEIIAAGSVILSTAIADFQADSITASLSDNLEGYRLYLGI